MIHFVTPAANLRWASTTILSKHHVDKGEVVFADI